MLNLIVLVSTTSPQSLYGEFWYNLYIPYFKRVQVSYPTIHTVCLNFSNHSLQRISVAVAWSVESLPSNPATRFRFPAGSGLLIFVLGLGVCPLCVLSCVVFGGGPDIVPTTHSGRPALVYLSSVLVQRLLLPLQASDPRAFGLKVTGGGSPRLGRG